jgi:hypothetical protein
MLGMPLTQGRAQAARPLTDAGCLGGGGEPSEGVAQAGVGTALHSGA